MSTKKRVLILCTGNSARSQMAEGLLRNIAGGRFEVESAGMNPSSVRSEAIEVMREIGIDISHQTSKSVDRFVNENFDFVITVCDNAKELCPVFPNATVKIHQSFDDPPASETATYEETIAVFRRVRDEIRRYLVEFARKN
ncbi:MAG: arsenate reductase ArsC [Pyrinomonadaceae bacterium]